MMRFLIGLAAALALGAGLYYFLLSDAPRGEAVQEELDRGIETQLQINESNRIPSGAVMEDGTLSE